MNPKLILVGGFLGAGKTTTILRLARWLVRRRHRVAIITNDQSNGLVDSSLVRADDFPVEEVAGGCFCCRSDTLVEKIGKLRTEARPTFIIAEPVGSCTDLVATVVRPLRIIYNTKIKFAPFSVLVDGFNMALTLGSDHDRGFAPEIKYIIKKQMEEAEVIALNKCDIFPSKERKHLKAAIVKQFPKATIYSISARTGEGCQKWFESLLIGTPQYQPEIDVDYEKYARGEALLGWFNGTGIVSAGGGKEFDPEVVLTRFAEASRAALRHDGAQIAHFKAILRPMEKSVADQDQPSFPGAVARKTNTPLHAVRETKAAEYCVVQIGAADAPITTLRQGTKTLSQGRVTINLRAQADPAVLSRALVEAMNQLSDVALFNLEQSNCFKPSKPTPIHRITGTKE